MFLLDGPIEEGLSIGSHYHEQLEGRLELTWTNKKYRFLAADDGRWLWVPPADFRVAEIRLLHDAGAVGDIDPSLPNLLIRGDAWSALSSLARIPSYSTKYASRIKLAYLDPPFNSQQAFEQYDDALEHSQWLTMMRDRLEQIRDLLAPDGSVWVHLDDSEVAYCRVLMDELFGRENFIATVIWEKTDSPRMDAKLFSVRHDTILVYRRSPEFALNRLPATDTGAHYNKIDEESGRRYYINPLRSRGGQGSTREARPNLYYPLIAPDGSEVYPKLPDGRDGAWRWSREKVERDAHLIEWISGRQGYTPWFRTYEPEERFRPPETIWTHEDVGSTRTSAYEIKRLCEGRAFATPKPERLLQRIIRVGTQQGDLVLDCFLGSGTTAAVAQKMGRRWIGVERESETIEQFALPRLTKVVRGEDPNGVTEVEEWKGGGGFQILTVGPSMFADDGGQVVLADWASQNALAEATAAQLQFAYEVDSPFCGRKGRSRLAVIDGHVSEAVVQLLVDQLLDGELLVVCGTSLDPAVAEWLREARPGSRVRKIPDSLLAEYRDTTRWRPSTDAGDTIIESESAVAAIES
jgi:adenine-specific DNA-methyltransferase